jgi:formylglycine-generating enzyme required for sulfatase activity
MTRRLMFAAIALAASGCAGMAAPGGMQIPHNAGAAFRECADCPEMVVVPAGEFVMGSPETEAMRDPDESRHKVTFAKPFAAGKYAVTWDEWMACVSDGACEGQAVETALRTGLDGKPAPNYADHGRGSRPVVGASWYDAKRFVGWLNARTGSSSYRLITEAEWEYAARAGTTTTFPWGDQPDHNYANFGKDEGQGLGGKAEGRDVWTDQTSPSGSFPANAFGLYDMHGNTYEWVEDCYQKDAMLLPTDGSAVHDGNCNVRVMRSTSFTSNPKTLRSANRAGQYPPNLRGRNYLSFRVARTLG